MPVDLPAGSSYVGPQTLDDPLLLPSLIVDAVFLLDQSTDPALTPEGSNGAGKQRAQEERQRLIEIIRSLLVSTY